MKIGVFDTDNYQGNYLFPSLPLMKLSEYHKRRGDDVNFVTDGHYDKIYQSKVFTFTPDYDLSAYADEVIRGGTGYAIRKINGKEKYQCNEDNVLPLQIEHIYPDYSLYNINDTAYGFITRGCSRNCEFCHVYSKEGKTHKVAELGEFWNGQRNIVLMDPNILMYRNADIELEKLAETQAYIDFNQGIDARLLTPEICKLIGNCKIKQVHFAMDHYNGCTEIADKINLFKTITGFSRSKITVYILVNFDSTISEDIERINLCRKIGVTPYVMRYDKTELKRGSIYNALARWVNNKKIFWNCEDFNVYLDGYNRGLWR